MSAAFQFRGQEAEAGDAAVLLALMEVWADSLAIIEDGSVLRANQAFAQIFGYGGGGEVQGQRLSELFPEWSAPASIQPEGNDQIDGSNNGGNRWQVREGKGRHRGGSLMGLQIAAAPLGVQQRSLHAISLHDSSTRMPGDGDLQPAAAVDSEDAALRNLETASVTRQNSLSENMETMGRLVGAVAHDFNNLLTGILLYSDLLIAGLAPESPMRAYAEEIRHAGSHSAGLVHQLLEVAQPQGNTVVANSWEEIISATRNLLSRLLGENIELVTELHSAGPVGIGPTRMRQILLNLLLNARDAMPAGGRICVRVLDRRGPAVDWVELAVSDTGCGMDAETSSRIFESFFTTKPPGQGSGLGLATVGRIVKDAGGTIDVASAPGTGTRVSVRLPCIYREAPGQDSVESGPVEDEEIQRH